MNVTLRQLRAFHEVAKAKSFTRAARRLHLTQSAVSMLVRQLEKECGLRLFHRVQRSVILTEAGEQMLPISGRILEDLRQVHEGVADLRALRKGTLRLAVPQMLACSWLPAVISKFREANPDIALEVMDTTGDRVIEAVLKNEAEIGIGPKRPIPDTVTAHGLWGEPIDLVCPADSDLLNRPDLQWADVLGENWILYSDDFSDHLERTVWANLPFQLPRATQVRYLTTALAFVGKRLGVTAAPRYASDFATQFNVRFVGLGAPQLTRHFYLYTRKGYELSPAAQAFHAMMENR
ncbi:unnamed protein product, partial [Laminaria digitata]